MAEETQTPTDQPEPKKRSKRSVALIVMGIALLIGAGIGVPYYLHSLAFETTDDAFVEGDVVPLSSRVPGYVSAIHVKDNQWVESGTILAEIDPTGFQVQVDLAKANVAIAEAAVGTAEAQLESARKMLAQAHTDIAVAEADASQAASEAMVAQTQLAQDQADLARIKQLSETTAVSKQQVAHAEAAVHTREAQLDAANQTTAMKQAEVNRVRAAEGVAEGAVAERASQVTEAKLRVDAAKAQLATAELALAHTKIFAPVAGTVTTRGIALGAWVQPGQVLLAVVPPDVWVVANLKETQLANIQVGQSVEISIDAYPGKTFAGHVDSIQPGTGSRFSLLPAQNATGNYVKVVQRVPVKIVLDNSNEVKSLHLVPGMSAVPEIAIKNIPKPVHR
ncbi:MAG: HlyD family secretion protein [Planctomycetes bacterium]|nr:HlyD family secretion protein [Planctomycetota bacterium]